MLNDGGGGETDALPGGESLHTYKVSLLYIYIYMETWSGAKLRYWCGSTYSADADDGGVDVLSEGRRKKES